MAVPFNPPGRYADLAQAGDEVFYDATVIGQAFGHEFSLGTAAVREESPDAAPFARPVGRRRDVERWHTGAVLDVGGEFCAHGRKHGLVNVDLEGRSAAALDLQIRALLTQRFLLLLSLAAPEAVHEFFKKTLYIF